jgi:enoyl-CoA hydratase/carnithine racemase
MTLLIERDHAVARIVLASPERRNALGPDEAAELAQAVRGVGDARALLVCAQGPTFCAGGDLAAIAALAADGPQAVHDAIYAHFQGVARALRASPAITFAVVDGGAVGLGADLALLCDVVLVGPHGWIDQGWARLGLIPGTGGLWLTRASGGSALAWDLVTSAGTRLGPTELAAKGLAIAATPSAEAEGRARAERVAALPPETIAAYKDLLSRPRESYEEHLERCAHHQARLLTTPRFAALASRVLGRASSRA